MLPRRVCLSIDFWNQVKFHPHPSFSFSLFSFSKIIINNNIQLVSPGESTRQWPPISLLPYRSWVLLQVIRSRRVLPRKRRFPTRHLALHHRLPHRLPGMRLLPSYLPLLSTLQGQFLQPTQTRHTTWTIQTALWVPLPRLPTLLLVLYAMSVPLTIVIIIDLWN